MPLVLRVSLTLFSLALVMGVGEVIVRRTTEIDKRLTVRDPVVGKRYVRSFDEDVFVPESGRTVRLRFNRDGFRGPDHPYEKPAGTQRVAVIGDSMTVVVATAEEKTMVADLERRLRTAFPGEHWEVLNFGVSSASTGQELVLYRELVWRYQPDIVVLAFFVGNDLADNSRRLTGARRIYFELDSDGGVQQLPYSAAASGLSRWLNQHSRLYVWYRIVRTRSRARMRELAGRLPSRFQVFNTSGDSDVDHAWELTRRLLAQFRSEVTARGSHFVVAVLPTGPQIYDDLWEEILENAGDAAPFFDRTYPERRLSQMCRGLGIPCVTMAEAFREAAGADAEGDEGRFFYNHGREHFTDRGNRLAAEILFGELAAVMSPATADPTPAAGAASTSG